MKYYQNSWTSTEKRDKMLAITMDATSEAIAYLAEKDTIRNLEPDQ
jgi:hypothetical protein